MTPVVVGRSVAPVRRGSRSYLLALGATQLCALGRYVLLARLLGPEQLGLAMLLLLTAQFFDAVTDSAGDRFLVQDRQGDLPEVQRLVHFVWTLRGLCIAAALALSAAPLAGFFERPELGFGLVLLGLAPLFAGFAHLDYRRQQRDHDFRGESAILLGSELTCLVVTAATAWLSRDYTAVVYGQIGRALAIAALSHLLAERPYRAAYSQGHGARLARFALPLAGNGLLLFLATQGDRLLIAGQLGVAPLGQYAAIILLIAQPASALQRYLGGLHLPLIAGADDADRFAHAADRLGRIIIVSGGAMAAGFALVAPLAVPIFYGTEFGHAPLLVAAIGILQATRFLRIWPVTVAMAQGRTADIFAGNLVRLAAFPAALAGMAALGGLGGIVVGFVAGDLLSLLVAVALANRRMLRGWLRGMELVLLHVANSAAILALAAMLSRAS